AYSNWLLAVIQTWGCACAELGPSAIAATSSNKPLIRRHTLFTSGRLGRFQQTASPQQRIGLRLTAAERDVGVFGIARASGRIDVVVQAFGHLSIEDVAGLLERAEGVGVHHLGPHITVIAGGIVIAGKHVAEL